MFTYLSRISGPQFQSGIITAAKDTVPLELEAGYNMVIMTSHHDRAQNRFGHPVVLNDSLTHVCRLPRAREMRHVAWYLLQFGYTSASAFLFPKQVVVSKKSAKLLYLAHIRIIVKQITCFAYFVS